ERQRRQREGWRDRHHHPVAEGDARDAERQCGPGDGSERGASLRARRPQGRGPEGDAADAGHQVALIRKGSTPAASALGRGSFLAASLFVVWHAFALVVAPFPPSYLSGSVHAAIFPYLSVLYLDTDWNFFAPTPAPGRFVRYVVQARDGSSHVFRLTEDR